MKGGQQLAHLGPHQGDLAFSSFISESRLGDVHNAPSCGLAPSYPGFLLGPLGLDLTSGNYPYLVLWRGTCPSWLSPPNGVPGSTQILTQHYGAQSQTISQRKSSGATPTSKFPQLSPFGLSKHPRMMSVQCRATL
jgi:hypothetical protein